MASTQYFYDHRRGHSYAVGDDDRHAIAQALTLAAEQFEVDAAKQRAVARSSARRQTARGLERIAKQFDRQAETARRLAEAFGSY